MKSLSSALSKASSLDPTPVRCALLELVSRLSDESCASAKDSLSDARSSRRHALREAVGRLSTLISFEFVIRLRFWSLMTDNYGSIYFVCVCACVCHVPLTVYLSLK